MKHIALSTLIYLLSFSIFSLDKGKDSFFRRFSLKKPRSRTTSDSLPKDPLIEALSILNNSIPIIFDKTMQKYPDDLEFLQCITFQMFYNMKLILKGLNISSARTQAYMPIFTPSIPLQEEQKKTITTLLKNKYLSQEQINQYLDKDQLTYREFRTIVNLVQTNNTVNTEAIQSLNNVLKNVSVTLPNLNDDMSSLITDTTNQFIDKLTKIDIPTNPNEEQIGQYNAIERTILETYHQHKARQESDAVFIFARTTSGVQKQGKQTEHEENTKKIAKSVLRSSQNNQDQSK